MSIVVPERTSTELCACSSPSPSNLPSVSDLPDSDLYKHDLPINIWLNHVAPHLTVPELCKLLTITREMVYVRNYHLKPAHVAACRPDDKLKKVVNLDNLAKISPVYHPGLQLSLSRRKGVKVDINTWSAEELKLARGAGRVTVETGDVNGLEHLADFKSVRFNYLPKTVDPALFGKIPKLHFDFCDQLSDVSSLGQVPDLSITCCFKVKHFSQLGGSSQKSLTITFADNLTDVTPFANVHTLDLSYCQHIEDVSSLKNVHTLNLLHCTGVTDVSMLVGLRKLILSDKTKKCCLDTDALDEAGVELERVRCGGCL